MFDRDRVLTLDLGASKIVLAEFQLVKGQSPVLLRYGMRPIEGETASESDRLAYIVSAIQDVMRNEGIHPAPVLMTVSGQAVFPRFVKLPAVGRDKLSQIIQYEAEQNVPFPMDEVVWDYQLLGGGGAEELNVMLVAAKIENIKRLTDCVQAAGLEPEIVDVSPMALYNAVRFCQPEIEGCLMVLDIGARSSNLIFIEQDRIFSRSIPVAGNAVTQELMKEFDVGFEAAEGIKLEHGFVAFGGVYAGPDNETAERASKIIRSVLTRLHAEVNRSINFYRSQQGGSPPDVVLLTGGSSLIPHLDTFFADKLKVSVDYFNPFDAISVAPELDGERLEADRQSMGEVVGLVLRRLGECPVEINLMPPELVAMKVFQRRKPYFALTAAGVVVTMLIWCLYFIKLNGVVEQRASQVKRRIADLGQMRSQLVEQAGAREQAAAKLSEATDLVASRTQWSEVLAAIRGSMQQGMWLTDVSPLVSGSEIQRINITVQAFTDRLEDTPQGTPSERFRNRLREHALFKDNSEITSLNYEGSYRTWFSISLELEKPIRIL